MTGPDGAGAGPAWRPAEARGKTGPMARHSRPPTRARRLLVVALVAAVTVLAGAGVVVVLAGNGGTTPDRPTAARATPTAPTTPTTVPPTTPSTVPPTTTATSATGPVALPPGGATAVGDSIMIDIEPYLSADVPGIRIDGQVSRQFTAGIGVVQADRASGTLGSVLVVELGTNGTITPSDFDAMMQAASGVTRVVFVNVDVSRSWAAGDNQVLAAGVARYPGVAVLADWYSESVGHPSWFTPDGVHLEPAGAQALATLVASKL